MAFDIVTVITSGLSTVGILGTGIYGYMSVRKQGQLAIHQEQLKDVISQRELLDRQATEFRNEMRGEIITLKGEILTLREKNMTLETVNLHLNKKILQLEHEMTMLREKNILLETENSQLIDRVQELENELGRIRKKQTGKESHR